VFRRLHSQHSDANSEACLTSHNSILPVPKHWQSIYIEELVWQVFQSAGKQHCVSFPNIYLSFSGVRVWTTMMPRPSSFSSRGKCKTHSVGQHRLPNKVAELQVTWRTVGEAPAGQISNPAPRRIRVLEGMSALQAFRYLRR
jgi:hypothetical protein